MLNAEKESVKNNLTGNFLINNLILNLTLATLILTNISFIAHSKLNTL